MFSLTRSVNLIINALIFSQVKTCSKNFKQRNMCHMLALISRKRLNVTRIRTA